MDFDPRSFDDARDRDHGRNLSRGRGSDTRERAAMDPREVFTRDLNLPRGPERERVLVRDHHVMLRGSESRTLATVGAFRVVPAGDLRDGDGRPLDPRSGDLKHLRREGLVQTIPVRGPDRALVVLTEKGREVLESHRRDRDRSADGEPERRDDRQVFYAGVQRPRELTHDAQVQRAYEREAERLREEEHAIIRRVRLENELKREYQAFLQEHNRGRAHSDGRPDRTPEEIDRWAAEHDLPHKDGHVQFPDARIEYEGRDGLLHTLDLEVETVHYHLRHCDLYAAIGEPDSRLRRPPAVPRALERLMVLDAILENSDIIWLSTPEAKIMHVSALARVPLERMPHVRVRGNGSDDVRYFPDRLPVGIHPEGRWVFVCLLTSPKGLELLAFLHRHAPLLSGLPAWTVRVAVPPHIAGGTQYRVDDACASIAMPLRDSTLAELRWYFEQLRPGSNMARSVDDEERFKRCARAFASPRWSLVYRSWRENGEAALEVVASDAIKNALASGAGRIERLALPHAYSHLAPLVGVA